MDKKELKKFGMILGGMIVFLFGFFYPFLGSRPYPYWPWIAGSITFFTSLLFPMAVWPIYKIWMPVAHALGKINSFLLLGILFYFLITPFACVMRLFGKDPLRLKSSSASSYRQTNKEERINMEAPY